MLLAASLCADTVLTYDSFDAQWGTIYLAYTDVGNTSLATSFDSTGTLLDDTWSYDVAVTTNLTDSLTFSSPLTVILNTTFTCQTSYCDGFYFVVTSDFDLATDPPFGYPLSYTAVSSSGDNGPGIVMQYTDDGGDWLVEYSPPTYNFSGQFPGSGGISYFQLIDNISVGGSPGNTTFTGGTSFSLGGVTTPEPATGLLLAAMLAGGLGWWQLRRRRSR
jgi:hypothetical protein